MRRPPFTGCIVGCRLSRLWKKRCWSLWPVKALTRGPNAIGSRMRAFNRFWGCGFLKSWTEDDSHMQQDTLLGVWLLEELDRGWEPHATGHAAGGVASWRAGQRMTATCNRTRCWVQGLVLYAILLHRYGTCRYLLRGSVHEELNQSEALHAMITLHVTKVWHRAIYGP